MSPEDIAKVKEMDDLLQELEKQEAYLNAMLKEITLDTFTAIRLQGLSDEDKRTVANLALSEVSRKVRDLKVELEAM